VDRSRDHQTAVVASPPFGLRSLARASVRGHATARRGGAGHHPRRHPEGAGDGRICGRMRTPERSPAPCNRSFAALRMTAGAHPG